MGGRVSKEEIELMMLEIESTEAVIPSFVSNKAMWEHTRPGNALCEVQHGVQDLVHAEGQGDPNHSSALQCSAQSAPGEWAQVQSGAGAGGHDWAGGHSGQGDFPVPHLQALPAGEH